MAEATPGIGEQRIDRAAHPAHGIVKLVDAFLRGEIGLHGLDLRTGFAEGIGRLLDFGLVRRDDEIEAVLHTALRQLKADTGGCARHERERPLFSHDVFALERGCSCALFRSGGAGC